jgi:hypothetical protein
MSVPEEIAEENDRVEFLTTICQVRQSPQQGVMRVTGIADYDRVPPLLLTATVNQGAHHTAS